MDYDNIKGLDKEISKLILGNDNQTEFDFAAKLWDHWISVGGNAFDNAHVYGNGSMETLMGKWQEKRKIREDIVLIAKGAHTPNCNPASISSQLTESLDRLKTNFTDIYIMHRDNLEIPVGEFMEVLNNEVNKRRIKIFGASNWTLERFKEANAWAEKNNMQPMSILNNNLALSKMIKPLWTGCVSSNDDLILDYLRKTQIAHLSWSSQGRGYFLPEDICQVIEDKITKDESAWRQPGENSSGPLSCYDSNENRERKNRAIKLAEELNATAQNIAGAWTLNHTFSSFALIGPREINEIDSSLPNLDIKLTKEQVDWLNLK
tara:strand:- start:138 stop:1097 length:960 start_codon:yes stop_codon:yes gene_type:complete